MGVISLGQIKPEQLRVLDEPLLTFGHAQQMEDPKDGLFLFGPLDDNRRPLNMRIGVIGTTDGIARYKRWVTLISKYVPLDDKGALNSKAFPGFKAVFDAVWPVNPICEIIIPDDQVNSNLFLADRHQAIFKTVGIFADAIKSKIRDDDVTVDIWFVVIPEAIHRLGRPKSIVPADKKISAETDLKPHMMRKLLTQPSLFSEDNEAAEAYRYEINFHHQLKARLIEDRAVIQIVRETSLTPEDFMLDGKPQRRLQDVASIAWNLSTTAYFKAGGRPWKIANVRDGVCYVGLVFKKDSINPSGGNACCGAQMFLDSGDGLVFKGAVGPWYSNDIKEFHIPYEEAYSLISKVIVAYTSEHNRPPKELFIHGKTRFNNEEWRGFREAAPLETNIVGVRIRSSNEMKLYSPNSRPVLRGTCCQVNTRRGYLWTKGFIPQLRTYPGREVPNPLDIEIHKGDGDLLQVMRDIMGLTKVNFNSCIFADGYPVTLRFAEAVGEILTAAPISVELPPLPFRHYI